MLAHRPRPGAVLSAAVGGAMEFLARGLAMDLLPVRVNCVSLGGKWIETLKDVVPGVTHVALMFNPENRPYRLLQATIRNRSAICGR